MTRPDEDRRLNLTVGIAVVLHVLLVLSSTWARRPPAQLVMRIEEEIAVRVEEEEVLLPAPGGGAGQNAEESVVEAPPLSTPKPPPPIAKAPRRVDVITAPIKDSPISAPAAAPLPNPPVTNEMARMAIPSNSRANQRMGRGNAFGTGFGSGSGNGPGGLFGNGQFVGDGPGALKAKICFIPESTRSVREIGNCETIYEQFLDEINIPPRRFEAGFPGFEDRTEWFAVNISGTFTVSEPGIYRFRLKSDDGSQLSIDNQVVVDNDGIHDAVSKRGSIELAEGRHRIGLRYFQGMKFILALQLFVTPPGQSERIFSSAL